MPRGKNSKKHARARRARRSRRHRAGFQPLESRRVLSATPLLIDINDVAPSEPTNLTVVGDVTYFVADDGDTGRELWVSDGTPEGTRLVADIWAGEEGANPTDLTAVGDTLFFVADNGDTGRELWKTDGTESGTVLVTDLYEGTYDYPLYDGTSVEIPNSSNVSYLTAVGDTLFFTANDNVHGTELWKSDGTAEGTVLVKDIWDGDIEGTTVANASVPTQLTAVGDTLYFVAGEEETGRELWKSDGTEEGTVLVKDIWEGTFEYTYGDGATVVSPNSSSAGLLTEFNGELYFVAVNGDVGAELWKSDGTEEGTVLVKDIWEGTYSGFGLGDTFVESGGVLYFTANDGEHGAELWKTDGTEAGTVMIKDIEEGENGNLNRYSNLTAYNGLVFFSASDGESGKELWVSDGTEAGTYQVTDLNSGTYDDGSARSSYPFYMEEVDGLLYFSAFTPEYGRELWVTDGTEAGTELVADAVYGPVGSYPSQLRDMNGVLVYTPREDETGRELATLVQDESFLLSVSVDGEMVEIPALFGVEEDGSTGDLYTLTDDGLIFVEEFGAVTLGDFFETWQTDAGQAGENSEAVFSSTQLMDGVADVEHTVQMFVNGLIVTEFDDYVVQAGDDIVLVYSSNPVISIVTNVGSIVIELYEDLAPGTVENFLNYVNDGDYLDSIFHRSVEDFVIQGGGFTTDSETLDTADDLGEVPTDDPIVNEPGESNLRGTIAMAKLSGDPDSATSQFFVNLSDDNTFLDDESIGEFTVFGMVLSMATADDIAELPIVDANTSTTGAFGELPLGADSTLVVVESIEGYADLTGVKFLDLDGDGEFTEGDVAQAGIRVYVDENENGEYDDGELSTLTDDEGRYLLQVEAGEYTVRAEFTGGIVTTQEFYEVDAEIGVEITGLDFAEQFLGEPDSVDLVDASDTGVANDDDLTNRNNADADSTLEFLVTGVTQGAEVRIYAGDVVIGSVIAESNEVVVTTDGSTVLADGEHVITATVTLSGFESDPSDSIVIDVDAVAPGAVTTDLPTELDYDSTLSLDLSSPDEGADGVAYSLVGAPDGMTIDADTGQLNWTPTLAQAAPHSFSVIVSDAAGNEAVTEVDLIVYGEIAARVDEYEVDEDNDLTVDAAAGVLANDGDETNGALSATVVDQPANGVVTLNADGSFTYTPNDDFFGEDTFTYSATDGSADTNLSLVTITVNPVQDPPAPVDDAYTLDEDETLDVAADFGVLANDVDADGDPLIAAVETDPANGQVTLNADGSFTYTPDDDFNGEDSFTYTVTDGITTSAPVTVTLTVEPVNDAPTAEDDAYSVSEDGTLTVDAANGVLANDDDIDSESLTVTVLTGPANGSLTLNVDGSFTYTPDDDFFGDDQFTYEVTDGADGVATAVVRLTVDPVDDAPVAADDDYEVTNDGASFTLNVLGNDDDVDGDDLTIISVSAGSLGGTITIADDGQSLIYIAPLEAIGTETFTYTVEDPSGLTATATVTVDVVDAGDATLSGFVYVDADNDGVRDADEVGIPGVFITLTGIDYAGNEINRAAITADDGSYFFDTLPSGAYEVSETQPVAHGDGFDATTVPGAVVTNDLISNVVVSGDDVFTENNFGEQGLTSEYVSVVWFFASSIRGDYDVHRETIAQAEEDAGNTDLADLIREGSDGSSLNSAPTTTVDEYAVDENATLTVSGSEGVLANDEDFEGDSLTAALVTGPSNGAVTLNADGSFTYVPATDFNGVDAFTYLASDGEFESAATTVTLTVNGDDDAPLTEDDEYTVDENATLTIDAAEGVLVNDADPEGEALTAAIVDGPANGEVTLDADGSFTYTPDTEFFGEDTFTYRASDGTLESDVTTVTITVVSDNAAPVAVDDAYEGAEDTTLTIDAAAGVLANDSDAEDDPFTAWVVDEPTNGTLVLNEDGSFSYTPDAGFDGVDTFTYVANDGEQDSAAATVTLTIDGVNEAPVAVGDVYTIDEDATVTATAAAGVLANDTDAEGDPLTVTLLTDASNGALTLNADGSFTYTPAANFSGVETFTYRVDDGEFESTEATVTINVNAVNDPPAVVEDEYAVEPGSAIVVPAEEGVLVNDSDVEAAALTAQLITGPTNGQLTFNADGSFTYTPDDDFTGVDTFDYRASDGDRTSPTTTVTLVVEEVNAAPTAVDDTYTIDEDATVSATAVAGVLANDTDAEGDDLTATLVSDAANGALTLNSDGSFTYAPNEHFNGVDTFTYKVSDGESESEEATVTFNIRSVNDVPVAADDAFELVEGEALMLDAAAGLLTNDSDADGDDLFAELIEGPTSGELSMNADGSFTYTPDDGYVGEDTFTYRVTDGSRNSPTATVTLTIAEGEVGESLVAALDSAIEETDDWIFGEAV